MAMLLHLFILYQLLPCGNFACMRKLLHTTGTEDQSKKVFLEEEQANAFLGRHLLANRFDFELFTPGNLERECFEEVCNYEEAREVFENVPQTDDFWKKYKEDYDSRPSRLDVTALLVGLIVAGVAIVIVGLLVWYFCKGSCKDNLSRAGSVRVRPRRSNASLIMRRLDEVSLQPVLLPPPPWRRSTPLACPPTRTPSANPERTTPPLLLTLGLNLEVFDDSTFDLAG